MHRPFGDVPLFRQWKNKKGEDVVKGNNDAACWSEWLQTVARDFYFTWLRICDAVRYPESLCPLSVTFSCSLMFSRLSPSRGWVSALGALMSVSASLVTTRCVMAVRKVAKARRDCSFSSSSENLSVYRPDQSSCLTTDMTCAILKKMVDI